MNKEICKKCNLCPEYFVLKQKRKLNIIKNYFYGYNGNCFKESTGHCLIIKICNIHYCNYPEEKKIYNFDEIFSHKEIKPNSEKCPYYFEHLISKWSENES